MIIFDSIISKVWMGVAIAAGALLATQTWRLHSEQADHAQLIAKVERERVGRIEVAAKAAADTATKESAHASTIQGASDAYTTTQTARDDSARVDLSRANRLRISAESRAASYRAQAEAGEVARRGLADRAEALDRSVTEGVVVVGELRKTLVQRDAEVVLLHASMMAARALCGDDPEVK